MIMSRDRENSFSSYSIPRRLRDANKGSYGRPLILAGSEGMCGAAYLAALAAYRSGAGLVRVISPESNRIPMQTLLPEAIFHGYKADKPDAAIADACARADFLCVGPGLGTGELSASALEAILHYGAAPMLLDADALNLISESDFLRESLKKYSLLHPTVLTPHPIEAARLLGCSAAEVIEGLETSGRALSKEFGSIVIMKSHNSLVIDESRIYKNTDASPTLAKGGSGDVLSGMISGIYEILKAESKHKDLRTLLYEACCISVSLHTEAGRIAADRVGEHSSLARDVADSIAEAMKRKMEE